MLRPRGLMLKLLVHLPLVVSGLVPLRHHIVSPPLNDAFREWRKPSNCLRRSFCEHNMRYSIKRRMPHLIPTHWWPRPESEKNVPSFLWKIYQSQMASTSLKIERWTFTGRRSITPCWRSDFCPVQWIMGRNPSTCRWASTYIFNYLKCWKQKNLFASGTSHEMLMVTSPLDHRLLHPRGLVPKLLGLWWVPWWLILADDKFY